MTKATPTTARMLWIAAMLGVWHGAMGWAAASPADSPDRDDIAAPVAPAEKEKEKEKDQGPRAPDDAARERPALPSQEERMVKALLETARQRSAGGDDEAAVLAYTRAHELSPKDPLPLILRGGLHQKLGQLAEAEQDLRAALRLSPRRYDVRADLGALLTEAGRPAEAEALLLPVVRERPDHFDAWFNLGVARGVLSRWSEAVEALRQAAKLRPQDADVQLNLSMALKRAGQLDEAMASAREAINLAPGEAQAHLQLGLMLFDRGRLDDAAVELAQATKLKPDLQLAWWRLGLAHLRRNQPGPAIVALQRAQLISANPDVLVDLGLAQRKQGSSMEAERSFRMALRLNNRHRAARTQLVLLLAAVGRCPEFRQELAALPQSAELTQTLNRMKSECLWAELKR